eukprot:jgi/Picre1/30093/NNA_005462.t1
MQRNFPRSMHRNNSSKDGKMHGQRGFYGRGIGLFVLGVIVGGLAMGGLHSHSKEVAFEDEGLDTTKGMDEVMPTSFSVMDRNGCVCRSCEEALAVAHDRLVGLEDRIDSCEKEATAREEEEFRRQDGLREDDTAENKEEEEVAAEQQCS